MDSVIKKEEYKERKLRVGSSKSVVGRDGFSIVNLKPDSLLFENFNRWLTTREAAEYFRTTPKQIRKWVYQGKIKAYKLCGKSLRFKISELDLLLEGGRTWE